jgi:hypothetical protein
MLIDHRPHPIVRWLIRIAAVAGVSACSAPPPANRDAPASTGKPTTVACQENTEFVALTIVTVETRRTVQTSRTAVFCVPRRNSLSVESGARIPYQAVAKNMVTTLFKDAGLTLGASITPLAVAGEQRVWMAIAYEDSHVLQQAGIPVRLTKLPMIETGRINGSYVFANGVERELVRWRRDGASSEEWVVRARANWIGPLAAPIDGTTLQIRAIEGEVVVDNEFGATDTVTLSADLTEPTPTARQPNADQVEFFRGRQMPVESLANNTSTWAYKTSGTSARIGRDRTGANIALGSTRFVTFSDVSETPQFYEDGTSVAVPISTEQLATPLRLLGLTTTGGSRTFVLRRFSSHDAVGAK